MDSEHVKAFRLFDKCQAEASGNDFQLKDWEDEHLQGCRECQELSVVFARLFKEPLPPLPGNGQINDKPGIYRNVCCGLEVFVGRGKAFPDCRRHPNLPTNWKRIQHEVDPPERDKKRSA
jgi:hypothetical protein